MNNIMMMLRKICNHPYLIEHPLDPKTGELVLNNDLIKHSGKMGMLDRMLPELRKNGHKVKKLPFCINSDSELRFMRIPKFP